MLKKYFIKVDDIGKRKTIIECPECGSKETIIFSDYLGFIMPRDVGKMMVKGTVVWQVENDEQFKKRINEKASG